MIKKVLIILGTVAAIMAPFIATVGACGFVHGETNIPTALKESL